MSKSNRPISVQVRSARLEDVESMARCHTRSIRSAYRDFLDPSDLEIFREAETSLRITSQIKSLDRVLVALVDDRIVGHARWGGVDADYWPYQVLVHALFIDPDHQRHRAGSALLRECAQEARSSGNDGMMIGAFIDNKPAMEWYARVGGRVIEEAPLQLGSHSYTSAFFAFDDLPALCSRLSGSF